MSILAYIISIVSFYITYLLSTAILGFLGMTIRRLIYKTLKIEEVPRFNGNLLSMVSYCSTMISYFTPLLIFNWLLDSEPNWFIITPIFVYIWYKISPALYSPFFFEGSAQKGMYSGLFTWFIILWKIHNSI
jgi:hypothetical protein